MRLDILLNLRQARERVSVILRNGQTRPELGVSHPQEDDRRMMIPALWDMTRHVTRIEPPATIDEPLPTRTQTILSHRAPEDVRRAIEDRQAPSPASSRLRCITLDLRL